MPPKPRQRTPFARWMWERGLTPRDLEKDLERSWEAIRCYAKDFDDPGRKIPPKDVMERIILLAEGELQPQHFYLPSAVPEDVQ